MAEVDYKLLFDIIENDFCYKKTDLGILVTVSTADGKEDVSINSDKFISIITSRYPPLSKIVSVVFKEI